MEKCMIILGLLVTLMNSKAPSNQNKILVLSDNVALYVTHSMFFDKLKMAGYNLDFKNIHSSNLNLIHFGEYQYDQLIIFSSPEEEIKGLKVREVMNFFDSGRNVMIIGNSDQSKYFRYMFNGFGIDMHELGSQVYDHFHHYKKFVTTNNLIRQEAVTGKVDKPILYQGSGLSLTPYETNQVFGILRASETAYSYLDEENVILGQNVLYVAATQGRNNARVVISGSYELFSNDALKESNFGNSELVEGLIRWNFGESGILKVENLVHRRIDSEDLKPIYFSCDILEWDYNQGIWKGYNADDVLMEFYMLDPYYRLKLEQNEKQSEKYEKYFKLPDKYGIFQFKINYQKPGYTYLNIAEKITIRPFRHDEYPRYLLQAFPYYLSSCVIMLGFLIFVTVFLLHKDK